VPCRPGRCLVEELLAAGGPVVKDGSAGTPALDEAGIEQDAQVAADGAQCEAGDRGQLRRAGGLVEEAQDACPGRAEQPAQGGRRSPAAGSASSPAAG
jgi:hypothetical protein